MRKTYRFSSGIFQGGYLYAHKIVNENIKNKEGLRNMLNGIGRKFKLIDVTIKIYDNIFFFYFMAKPSVVPFDVVKVIQQHINLFGLWDKEYIYTGVYDLQEEYLRKDLRKLGFDYDEGG